VAQARLTVIIPAYNEAGSISLVAERVLATGLAREIIVVDDGSNDGTVAQLERFNAISAVKVIRHPHNRGKGAAIRTGLAQATSEFVIIQDADLELDPADFPAMIAPLLAGESDVVYGMRTSDNPGRGIALFLGVRMLTYLTNFLYGSRIHDEACGYKAFRLSLLRRVRLVCERFEFCPEVTAKLLRLGVKIVEVPVSYNPRSNEAGKKLRLGDGLTAMLTLMRYRFVSRRSFDLGEASAMPIEEAEPATIEVGD